MNNGAMNKDIELKISELEKTLEKLRILELRISKFRSEYICCRDRFGSICSKKQLSRKARRVY